MERPRESTPADQTEQTLEKLSAEIKNIRSLVRSTLSYVAGLGFLLCFTTLYQTCHEQDRETRFQIMALKAKASQDEMEEYRLELEKERIAMEGYKLRLEQEIIEFGKNRVDFMGRANNIIEMQRIRLDSMHKTLQNCECK